jgi:4-hydroxy-tetrahydrodipicolinate synthase
MSTDIRSALHGLFPAPAVPFDDNLALAEDEFTAHLKTMSAVEGVSGFAVNGHAGEVGTLTPAERLRVVQLAREAAGPGQVIISGIDCVEPGQAVAELRELAGAGANAALVLPPFDSMARRGLARNRDSVYQWFEALGAADVPLVVFQYPLSTGCSYPTAVLRDVVTLEHVVAVKNAVWSTEFYIEQLAAIRDHAAVLAACDAPELLAMMMAGCDGLLLGASNVATASWAEFTAAILRSDYNAARELFVTILMPLLDAQFGLTRPRSTSFTALTKEALCQLGIFSSGAMRPPDITPDTADRAQVTRCLEAAGLIKPA